MQIEKKARTEAPKDPRNHDDAVLVPLNKPTAQSTVVNYATLKDYKADQGKNMTPDQLKKDLDDKAILIKTNSGTFLHKNQIYASTFPSSYGPKVLTDAEKDVKNASFSERMEALGLSKKTFSAQHEKLSTDEKKLATAGGERKRNNRNTDPVVTGEYSPDLLIRKDGKYQGVWATNTAVTSLSQLQKEYGKDNVMIKNAGNSYMTAETLNRNKDGNVAEKLMQKYTGAVATEERKDMAKAYFKVNKDLYVSRESYEARFAKEGTSQGLKEDLNKVDVLFQSPSGHGLLNAKGLALAVSKTPGAKEKIFAEAGLNPDYAAKRDVTNRKVMVRVDKDIVASGKSVMDNMEYLETTRANQERRTPDLSKLSLSAEYSSKDIFIQNISKKGELTGNYAHKTRWEETHKGRDDLINDTMKDERIKPSAMKGDIAKLLGGMAIDTQKASTSRAALTPQSPALSDARSDRSSNDRVRG